MNAATLSSSCDLVSRSIDSKLSPNPCDFARILLFRLLDRNSSGNLWLQCVSLATSSAIRKLWIRVDLLWAAQELKPLLRKPAHLDDLEDKFPPGCDQDSKMLHIQSERSFESDESTQSQGIADLARCMRAHIGSND